MLSYEGDRFWPCGHIQQVLSPQILSFGRFKGVGPGAAHDKGQMKRAGSVPTWVLVSDMFGSLSYRVALPFICSYSRNNFLFKAFRGKRARKALYESVLNCASQKCVSWQGTLCVGKLTSPLATSLPPRCLVEVGNWRTVLTCLLYLIHLHRALFKPLI